MNAIIGAAYGYQWKDLWPLVVSARRNAPDAKLILLTNGQDAETRQQLAERGVWSVPCNLAAPYSAPYVDEAAILAGWSLPSMHMVCSRFVAAYCFLKTHGHELDRVLLVDTRDTLIAADPFAFAWDESRACVAQEDERMSIGACPYNSKWIQNAYGASTLAAMSSRRIVCVGAIAGQAGPVEHLLGLMLDEFAKQPSAPLGLDTASLNWILNYKPDACRVYASGESPIYHAGYFTRDKVNFEGHAVIHQYDRFAELAPALVSKLTGGA